MRLALVDVVLECMMLHSSDLVWTGCRGEIDTCDLWYCLLRSQLGKCSGGDNGFDIAVTKLFVNDD